MNKINNFLNEYGGVLNRKKTVKKVSSEKKKSREVIPKASLNYIEKLIELLTTEEDEKIVEKLLKTTASKRRYNLHFSETDGNTRKKIYSNLLNWDYLHDLLKKHGLKQNRKKTFSIVVPESIHFGKQPLSLCPLVDAIITEITHASDIGLNNRVIVQLLIDKVGPI